MSDLETMARRLAEQYVRKGYEDGNAELDEAATRILDATAPPTMADVEWDVDEMPSTGALTKHGRLWIMRDDAGDAIECISPDLEEIAFVAKKELTPNGKRYELREVSDEPENPVEPSTKTMDEYSTEEQAGMIGMWAEYRRGGEPRDFMIIEGGVNQAGRVPCYNPDAPTPHAWAPDPDELIPRFDLPRVWDKDGQPCEATVSSGENVGANQPEHPEVLSTVEDYENAPAGTIVAGNTYLPLVKMGSGVWLSGYGNEYSDGDMADDRRTVLRWGWGE